MHKIIKIILIAVGVVGAILWTQLPDGDAPMGEAVQSGPMNFMFILTYLLIAIAVLASVIFGLKNLFSTSGSLKKALFAIGGLAIVVAVSYGLASGTDISVDAMANRGIETSESTIKTIGMGLNVFFILTIVAVGLMLWGGLKKLTSK
ncbi:hypothetical protein [Costertonia aggregata]|uniref:Uncharacterized protein n=1 Tax=Costertonia aggregata TaxID=343403 RepID=A0A7H9AML9_9FLAO|nr:hypothetical protein [Costertonia aggregata]QLG44613.1 hypothetical protein HYG79_04375 [Costertonia aggregata]